MWSGNGKIYFFKDSQYWRFDPDQSPPVRSSYPRPSTNWDGLPPTLDAALLYKNGFTYFFKDNQYWRFNDRRFSVRLLQNRKGLGHFLGKVDSTDRFNLFNPLLIIITCYHRLIPATQHSPDQPLAGGSVVSPNLWCKVRRVMAWHVLQAPHIWPSFCGTINKFDLSDECH